MSEENVKGMLGTLGKVKQLADAAKYLPVAKAADKLKAGMPVEDYMKAVIDLLHEVCKVQGIHYRDMKAGQAVDIVYDLVNTDKRVRGIVVDLLKPLVR
jgi:hypothetical protein